MTETGGFGVCRRSARAKGSAAIVGATVMLVSSCFVEPAAPVPGPTGDTAVVALDIVPAGSFSVPSYGDVGREARMYDSLTPRGRNVTDADVDAGFKGASLGLDPKDGVMSSVRPRAGLEIVRDGYNVPHVVADTDEKAIWAVGWLSAEHSPLVYEAARRNGRIAAAGVPGGDAVNSAMRMVILEPTAAADAVLQRQIDRLASMGDEGTALLTDIDAFVAGYNAKLDATLSILPRWTRIDVIAMAAFKADWWGRGQTSVSYPIPVDPLPSVGGAETSDGLDGVVPTRYAAAKASNFALVSGERSSTGHPLLIGGPQIGYMYPGVAFEVDVNSPGIDMRGLTAPAYPGYVFIGRGADFAWTINVALDAVTAVQVPVSLCGGGSSYLLGDVCTPFGEVLLGEMRDVQDLLAPPRQVSMKTTVYGPVDWIDTFSDRAYVLQRPGIGDDVSDMLAFRRVNRGQARGPEKFREAMQLSPQAFYAGYVDAEHIAAFQTCSCVGPNAGPTPVARHDDLVVPMNALPSALDPENGIITNWNEPMRTTEDGNWIPPDPWASRRDWFEAFDAVAVHTVPSLVGAMNDLATRWGGGTTRFMDLIPGIEGARPPDITTTSRSSGIQLIMSFGDEKIGES